jgi:osmotically-inducible protein OsmY
MSSQTDRGGCLPSREVVKGAKACLERSPYMAVRAVSCQYDGGVLFLRGRLPSFYHKQLAQEAIADLEGVAQVVNETEVRSSLA